MAQLRATPPASLYDARPVGRAAIADNVSACCSTPPNIPSVTPARS